MVKNQVEYDATLWAQRVAQRQQRFEDKLKRQASQLGYQLVPVEENLPLNPLAQKGSENELLKKELGHPFRSTSTAFSPPNANEFESAHSICADRAWLGTTSRSHSGST